MATSIPLRVAGLKKGNPRPMNVLSKALSSALLGLVLGAALPAVQAQDHSSPTALIESGVNIVLDILKADLPKEERNAQVREAATKLFDDRAMAQSVLSTNWRQASPEQQQEFQSLFAQLLESTYIDRLDAYTNQSVEMGQANVNGDRATVSTRVLTDQAAVPVVYKLRQRSDGWWVYDVEVENVSLVNSYRETYLSVVRRSGMDGLLQQMRDKIAELESARQAEGQA